MLSRLHPNVGCAMDATWNPLNVTEPQLLPLLSPIMYGTVAALSRAGPVGALGGRLGVYRAADGSDDLRAALVRNLWRGNQPDAAGLAHVMAEVGKLRAALMATPVAALIVADRLDGAPV